MVEKSKLMLLVQCALLSLENTRSNSDIEVIALKNNDFEVNGPFLATDKRGVSSKSIPYYVQLNQAPKSPKKFQSGVENSSYRRP